MLVFAWTCSGTNAQSTLGDVQRPMAGRNRQNQKYNSFIKANKNKTRNEIFICHVIFFIVD